MRCALVVFTTTVFAIHARSAWCETTARTPSAVVAAVVEGDPENASLEAAADEIAAELHIDRAASAQRWRSRVRDEYKAPTLPAISDATAAVYGECPDPYLRTSSRAVAEAAETLAQVTGDAPTSTPPGSGMWFRPLEAARRAQRCLGTNVPAASMRIHVHASDERVWTLYVNGVDVATEQGAKTVSSNVAGDRDLWIHARCVGDIRCSRTIHVTDLTRPVTVYIDAVDGRTTGRMSDEALTLVYPSELDRNNGIATDAAIVAYVLGNAGGTEGDAISVMAEGTGLRLVYSDEDGKPIRTLRTTREDAVAAAVRLAGGASQTAVVPLAGKRAEPGVHEIRVELKGGAPKLSDVQSSLDPRAVPGAAVCKGRQCSFSAPAGKLRMRFDESGWSEPMQKNIDIDKNLLLTVRPGRRYWAKYTGLGMIAVGGSGMALVTLLGGLENKLGSSVHDATRSGGDTTPYEPAKASNWELGVFFGGAGAVAVGTVLYLVVHKKPSIRVTPLGAVSELKF